MAVQFCPIVGLHLETGATIVGNSQIAPLAQLVQSISFTPIGSEVRILQGAQTTNSRNGWPGGEIGKHRRLISMKYGVMTG